MTEEVIGTARLDVVVGTDGLTTGVHAVKTEIRGLNADAQKQFDQMTQAQKRLAVGFVTSAQNAGKSREEIRALAAEMKIGGALGKQLADNLRAAGKAGGFKSVTNELNQYGMSAKQTAAALRGLPAQITDIVTGLASGQRPLTILFQQGGQLKDMFGGIVPAARAVGGAVLRMANPFTLAAVAVAGLGLAWNQAEKDRAAFTVGLLTTGNFAGKTTDQLEGLVGTLSELQGVTASGARDAISQVAASGRFAGQQFDLVAQSAARMEASTGQAIDTTIKKFEEIAKSPTEALLKLNETEHFLTQAQFDRVRALEEEGRQQDAAEEGARIYAQRLAEVANAADAARPHLVQMWTEVKQGVVGAWEEVKNFSEFLAAAGEQFNNMPWWKKLGPFGAITAIQAMQNAQPAVVAPIKPVAGAVDSAAEKEFLALKDRYQTREEQKTKALAELDRLRLKLHLSDVEVAKIRAGIEGRFKPPKGRNTVSGIESATSKRAVQAFEDQLKKEQGLIANQTQILEANYAARNITVSDYYKEQKRLAEENTSVQVKALEGEIAALAARNVKGKVSIENATQIAQKEAELAKVRADGATKLEILNIQEAAQLKQRQQLLTSYNDALKQTEDTLKDELDNQVLRISMGEREFEMRSRINQILRQQSKELLELARARDADPANADLYDKQAAALEASVARQVQAVRDGYRAMSEAQANWANGALKAFADYRDAANDVAGQTYGIFSDALHGLEDVLTDFFTKGRADWKGFFDGIATEITRFVIRQQLSNLVKKFIPGMGEEQGSNADALKGAAASLAASSGPLYGAAAALSASAAALAAAGVGNAAAGGATGGSGGSGWFGFIASLFGGGFAKGGMFDHGVQKFATGGVVSRPTFFPMAGGRMGLMGEERPEAILPLHRGPDGKLGVRMAANDDMPRRLGPAVVNQTVIVQGRIDSRTPDQFAQATAREQNRAASRNR